MTIINLEELTALIDTRVCEIVLKHNEIIEKISDRAIEKITDKLLSNGINRRNTLPSDKKVPIKQDDSIEGKEIREILSANDKKRNFEKTSERLIRIATKRNQNKKPYNIRRTINYILDYPEKEEFSLPEMSDELALSTTAIRRHLELLRFNFDESKRVWIKPKSW